MVTSMLRVDAAQLTETATVPRRGHRHRHEQRHRPDDRPAQWPVLLRHWLGGQPWPCGDVLAAAAPGKAMTGLAWPGRPVRLRRDTGSAAQVWQITDPGSRSRTEIINKRTGLCLDAHLLGTAAGQGGRAARDEGVRAGQRADHAARHGTRSAASSATSSWPSPVCLSKHAWRPVTGVAVADSRHQLRWGGPQRQFVTVTEGACPFQLAISEDTCGPELKSTRSQPAPDQVCTE